MQAITIDIKTGIAPEDLQNALRSHEHLILKGMTFEFEFTKEKVSVKKRMEALELAHLPDEIEGMELSEIEKQLLLDGETLSLGAISVRLEKGILDVDRGMDLGMGI